MGQIAQDVVDLLSYAQGKTMLARSHRKTITAWCADNGNERRTDDVKSYRRALLYGFLLWLIPFSVSLVLFPMRSAERPLFESIMAVVLTISCVLFAKLYFRKLEGVFIREGVILGLLWLGISVVIDLPLLTSSPVNMSFVDYVKDIGLTYLIFPTVTTGFGYLCSKRDEKRG